MKPIKRTIVCARGMKRINGSVNIYAQREAQRWVDGQARWAAYNHIPLPAVKKRVLPHTEVVRMVAEMNARERFSRTLTDEDKAFLSELGISS